MAYECWCLYPWKLVRLGNNKKYVVQSRKRNFLQLVTGINSKALSISRIQWALELVTVSWCRFIFLSPYSKITGPVQWLAKHPWWPADQYQPPPNQQNNGTQNKFVMLVIFGEPGVYRAKWNELVNILCLFTSVIQIWSLCDHPAEVKATWRFMAL